MQPIRFRSEQSINGVKIKRLAYGGGGKNNPQCLVPYNDGFVLYIAAQCNFVYLHVLRESAILVSFFSISAGSVVPAVRAAAHLDVRLDECFSAESIRLVI